MNFAAAPGLTMDDRARTALLDVQDLSISFMTAGGLLQATRDVSFSVAPGERMLALLISDDGRCRLFANRLFALKPMDGCELIEYSDTGATFGAVYGQFVRINLAANPDLIDRAITRMADSL